MMESAGLDKCPGLYCGRTELDNGTWSDCGVCPRGFRSNLTSFCIQCTDTPTSYDYLYLGFMSLLPLVLHWFCIDNTQPFRGNLSGGAVIVHLFALLETLSAAVITVLLVEPIGEFNIQSCKVRSLSDWYTLFLNPKPNYSESLHCTQEAVYPLHTMVFIFYGVCVIILMLFRPCLVHTLLPSSAAATVYAPLYFFPILTLLHACLGGLIYYTFPYIIIVLSVISNAAHFAFKMDQSARFLVLNTVTDVRNVLIVLGHWIAHGYGIISLSGFNMPVLIALVPLPAIFYIATASFTDPHKLHTD